MRSIFFLLLMGLSAGYAAGDPLSVVLAPSATPRAGEPFVFLIYFHNTADKPVTMALEPELTARLTGLDGQSIDIICKIIQPGPTEPYSLAPQSFVKAQYEIQIPENMQGPVQLALTDVEHPALLFALETKAPPEKEKSVSWASRAADEPLDTLIGLYQPYARNISFYEPMYFLVGADPKDSKFQLSLKYRFVAPDKVLAQKYPWVRNLYFGYTQTSFWNLKADSAPFEDTSYKPELFLISRPLHVRIPQLDGVFIKTGVRHESNGRGGDLSRSTNTAYIEPIFIYYNERRRTGLKISVKAWTYFKNEDENNPDLEKYRGYFNLGLTFGRSDGLVFDTGFWWASEGASLQVDATFPLHVLVFSHLDLYFQIQYVNRLAESLLDYKERTQAVRLGFAIVR